MVHNELKAYIESKPHIESVWLAEDGTWYFVAMEGLKQVSREDILGAETLTEETPVEETLTEETPVEEVEPTKTQSQKKQTKK